MVRQFLVVCQKKWQNAKIFVKIIPLIPILVFLHPVKIPNKITST